MSKECDLDHTLVRLQRECSKLRASSRYSQDARVQLVIELAETAARQSASLEVFDVCSSELSCFLKPMAE